MKHVQITVRGSVAFEDDEWAVIERHASELGMTPEQYLRDEPSVWWNDLSVDQIDIDVL